MFKKKRFIRLVSKGTIQLGSTKYATRPSLYYYGKVSFELEHNLNAGHYLENGRNCDRLLGISYSELRRLVDSFEKGYTRDTMEEVKKEMDAWVEKIREFVGQEFDSFIEIEYEPIGEVSD